MFGLKGERGIRLSLSIFLVVATGLQETPVEQVADAFQRGDTQTMLTMASNRVEIALLGSSMLYSRAQATYILDGFFQEHPPERFEVEHESKTERGWFAVGTYWYERAAEPLRIYVGFRLREDQWQLVEVRIEERPQGR